MGVYNYGIACNYYFINIGEYMKKRFQKGIDEVLKEFDFERVHKVMTLLEWKWCVPGRVTTEIPTLEYIKDRAKEILQHAAEEAVSSKDEYYISTGGFRAEAKYYKKDPKYREKSFLWVRLAFEIEEWGCDEDDISIN